MWSKFSARFKADPSLPPEEISFEQDSIPKAPSYLHEPVTGVSIRDDQRILWLIPVTGQSLANGDSSPAAVPGPAIATASRYPGRALMLENVRTNDERFSTGLKDAVETLAKRRYGYASETILTSMLTELVRLSDAHLPTALPRFAGLVSAQGGADYANLKRGSRKYSQLIAGIEDVVAYAHEMGLRVIVPATCLIHGESHSRRTSRSQYLGMLRQWSRDLCDDIRQVTGQIEQPIMFLSQCGTVSQDRGVDQSVQLAQIDAGMTEWARLVGPNYNLPRAGDELIHLSSVGQNRLGHVFARAIFHELYGQGWSPLQPVDVWITSTTTVRIECHVPSPPIIIDETSDVDPTGFPSGNKLGFDVQLPDGGFAEIAAVTVENQTTLILHLASPLSVPWVTVAYAMRGSTPTLSDDGPTVGARGCVRDSSEALSQWEDYKVRNWMVMWSRRCVVPALS